MNSDLRPAGAAKPPGVLGAGFALFAFVFGMRAWLILVWGSPVPFWDQWNAEALGLFRPWLDGTLRWSDLFAAHNEHRIALTRVADLGLLLLDGHWNIWWQLLLNAALHAATAAALAVFLRADRNAPVRTAWLLGLAVLFSVPSGWQNALWGFQSQVYFGSLLAVLALACLLTGKPLRGRWWLGWLCALLALFAIGSGVLAAVAVLLVSAAGLLTPGHVSPAGQIPCTTGEDSRFGGTPGQWGLLAVLALVILGWFLRVEVPQHETLRAHSLTQFGAVFVRCLGWPWVNSSWLWLVMQAPLVWFIAHLIRRRSPLNGGERLALGLGLLAGLHAVAVACSRGAGLVEARPLSRYQDPLLLGVAANLFVLLQFVPLRLSGRIAALVWSGILLAGLIPLTATNLSVNLPFKRAQDDASLAQVRSYLSAHDATVFTRDPEFTGPHPDPAVVRRVLDDPLLRPLLPVEFSKTSSHPPGLIALGPWLALVGSVLLLGVAIGYFRPTKP